MSEEMLVMVNLSYAKIYRNQASFRHLLRTKLHIKCLACTKHDIF